MSRVISSGQLFERAGLAADRVEVDNPTVIYCVVPAELADELYPKLTEHYRNDENVTVIVERRSHDRRARAGSKSGGDERRKRRDRRRPRAVGDPLPLPGA
jgi:hypothetical protein